MVAEFHGQLATSGRENAGQKLSVPNLLTLTVWLQDDFECVPNVDEGVRSPPMFPTNFFLSPILAVTQS